jgi:hypothetical protein
VCCHVPEDLNVRVHLMSWAYKENQLSLTLVEKMRFFICFCHLLDMKNSVKSIHELFTVVQTS